KNAMISPWVKWLGEYQSVMCWLLPLDCTMPCHSLTSPHSQIGGRSMADRVTRAMSKSTAVAIHALRCGASEAFILRPIAQGERLAKHGRSHCPCRRSRYTVHR